MKKGRVILPEPFKQELANLDSEELQQEVKKTIEKFIELGDFVQASNIIAEYELIVANDSTINSMKAIIAILEYRWEDAEGILCDALFLDTTNFDLWYNLAYLYENKGTYFQAYSIYNSLLEHECSADQTVLIQDALERVGREAINDTQPLQQVKILHGTMEIANQMHFLTSGLQKKGFDARSVNYYESYIGYQNDIEICYGCKTPADVAARAKQFTKQALNEYEIFHFYYGKSLNLDNSDLPLLKSLGKKMLMNYMGSDVRHLSITQKYNPYVKEIAKKIDEQKIINGMSKIAKYIKHCAVGDQELYLYVKDFFPNVHILPAVIDIDQYSPKSLKANKKPLFVHAPTSPELKGTKFILRAIEILQQEYDFDFQLIQGMSHEQAKLVYQQADLIIDQILLGSHGVLAIEAMAMEKPVVCWISDYMRDKYFDDLPIIIANPDTITGVLRNVLGNMDMLAELGKRGRKYVEKNHNANNVAERLISIYRKL